jgi:hypothetical protein
VPLPADFVCVINNGAGDLICFQVLDPAGQDTQRTPIMFWDHELDAGQVPRSSLDPSLTGSSP